MSATRTHVHEETFDASVDRVFALLHTPSAIRAWWGAARAIVMPEPGGLWAAAWGEREDEPKYSTSATMTIFDPPRRIRFEEYRYRSPDGALPFDATFVTTFEVEPAAGGAVLRVIQDGFPPGPEADEFYEACGDGWAATFGGIRRFLEAPAGSGSATS